MTEVFVPHEDENLRYIKKRFKDLGASNFHRRHIGDEKTSFNSLPRFCVLSKNQLGEKRDGDKLLHLKISKLVPHPVTFKSKSGQSFQITYYSAEISYTLILARYRHYKGFSKNVVTDHDYRFEGHQEGVVLVSVSDIFKYCASQELRFNGNKKTIDAFNTIIKNSLRVEPVINDKDLFGSGSLIYDVDAKKIKWDFENFLGQLIAVKEIDISNPILNLLSNYHYGCVFQETKKPETEFFDIPISVVEAFEKFEDLGVHQNKEALRLMKKKLTRKQTQELEERYTDFVINDNFLTPLVSNRFGIHQTSYSYRKGEFYKDRGAKFSISYPIYAFRNLYVKRWIPHYTGDIIARIVLEKHQDECNGRIKRLKYMKGRDIDRHESRKFKKYFKPEWSHSENHFQKEVMRRKDERAVKYEMKLESIDE